MNKPMIENTDRGITLNKTLAWTMLVALVSLVWFGGTTVASLKASTDNLAASITEARQTATTDRQAAVRIEARVRALETNASRTGAEFEALRQSLNEVKSAQRETNDLLRRMLQPPQP